MITAEEFKTKTGHAPKDDDLDRANCDKVGQFGHSMCGWCIRHDKPRWSGCCAVQCGKFLIVSGNP